MKRYVAKYVMDEDGVWCGVAKLAKHTTAHSQGRTLEVAQRRMHEAIALLLGCHKDAFSLAHEFEESAEIASLAERVRKAREAVASAREAEQRYARQLAAKLKSRGYSLRDVGTRLELSRQRISQILKMQ